MTQAAHVPRPRWHALYATLGMLLAAAVAGETLQGALADIVEIGAGLAVIATLVLWVRTNRAELDLDATVAPAPREAYTGGMARMTVPRGWRGYVEAAAMVAVCSAAARLMFGHVDESSLAMVYLAGVVVVATRGSRGAALFACLASVAAFDFFFVPPYFTLAVAESRFVVTFAVMLVVALVISGLTRRARVQGERAEAERVRSALLSLGLPRPAHAAGRDHRSGEHDPGAR